MTTARPVLQEPFPPVPMEVIHRIITQSDIQTVLQWRAVNDSFAREVDGMLYRAMARLVRVYVGRPEYLLQALWRYRAVISAETALAFFLDDPNVLNRDLEICVPRARGKALQKYLKRRYRLVKVAGKEKGCRYYDVPSDLETVLYVVVGSNAQRFIRIVCMPSPSALAPLSARLDYSSSQQRSGSTAADRLEF
ncbi:hypothetical protein C8Q76DRAFT_789199 [Earliella scabrosa]|nr:hypothetical protein C8Q76DRAFT_789199 [Earliella scabrosa]